MDKLKPVKSVKIKKDMTVKELVEQFNSSGFQSRRIAEASEILRKMKRDGGVKFFGLAGALVPSGMRQIVVDMIEQGYIDVFVTTGASLTHDLIKALGENHYLGDDKANDEELNEKGINRIHSVFMKNSVYEKLEDFFEKNWGEFKYCKTIKEFLWKVGELINDENSILRICYKKKIPIFCPALADCGIGLMVWGRKMKGKEIFIDAFEDMKEIIDIAWTSKKNSVFYVGGGVPKNFIQQSLQFSKGADYGIQIKTDNEAYGGSSGAPLKEGISWGKMNKEAEFVDVICDATIALPLILGGV